MINLYVNSNKYYSLLRQKKSEVMVFLAAFDPVGQKGDQGDV